MRNPARIYPVLAKVAELWAEHPDMRLGQLLWKIAGKNPFYMEDDQIIAYVNREMQKDRPAD